MASASGREKRCAVLQEGEKKKDEKRIRFRVTRPSNALLSEPNKLRSEANWDSAESRINLTETEGRGKGKKKKEI